MLRVALLNQEAPTTSSDCDEISRCQPFFRLPDSWLCSIPPLLCYSIWLHKHINMCTILCDNAYTSLYLCLCIFIWCAPFKLNSDKWTRLKTQDNFCSIPRPLKMLHLARDKVKIFIHIFPSDPNSIRSHQNLTFGQNQTQFHHSTLFSVRTRSKISFTQFSLFVCWAHTSWLNIAMLQQFLVGVLKRTFKY